MPVDPEEYRSLSGELYDVFDPNLNAQIAGELIDKSGCLVVDEVAEPNAHSQSPRLYVFGRSGAGKSSLINALAGGQVTEVGTVEPTTVDSNVYDIEFSGQEMNWEVVDSRGLFESTPADGADSIETVKKLAQDLVHYNPDFILHILTPEQVRAGADDFEAIEELDSSIPGGLPPRIICINKVDLHLSPGDSWPPEQNQTITRHIVDTLELVAEILSVPISRPFVEEARLRGVLFDSAEIAGAFPIYLKDEPHWNLPSLAELLREYLPGEGLLQSAQSQRQQRFLRQLARKQTRKIVDTITQLTYDVTEESNSAIVLSYQRYLIALIGSFAGAPLTGETVREYIRVVGSRNEVGSILPAPPEQAAEITVSFLGMELATLQASMENIQAYTYGIGRSAEAYFFDEEAIPPEDFINDAAEDASISTRPISFELNKYY